MEARPHGGGNTRKLSDADIAWMESERPQHADRIIKEWQEALARERGMVVSRSAVSRVFVAVGWTRKKGHERE